MFRAAANTGFSDATVHVAQVMTRQEGVWIVIEDGEFRGMTMITDRDTGDVVGLSARNCSNQEKRKEFPPLKDYPALKVIDLHNYRYMRSLHVSIGDLSSLERLLLTRCDLLKTLPSSIGNLKHLVEVWT
jgi:hypothetical protein